MVSGNCGSKWMLKQGRTVLVLLLSLSLVFTHFTMALAASEAAAKTKMKHSPPKYFVPEHRIQLDVRVSDPKGVELVRCYFKTGGETDFVFVPMASTGKNIYSGVLPAPSLTSEQIEYLFLSVNAENVIVKSQSFVLDKKDKNKVPAWQEIPMENEIQVGMELDQVPSELAGFSDNIAMDAVESSLRFGIVAGGLYQSSAAATAATTGSAASATTVGTVSAGAAGLSTAGIVGLSALGAVAVGGAAAAGSSSGSSGDTNNPALPTNELTESSLVGNWKVTVNVDGSNVDGYYAVCTFNDNGSLSLTEYEDGMSFRRTSGNWSYDSETNHLYAESDYYGIDFINGTIFPGATINSFTVNGKFKKTDSSFSSATFYFSRQ